MAADFIKVLQEIRGTGEPEALYTDGIYHDLTIKTTEEDGLTPRLGAGVYGAIQSMYGTIEPLSAQIVVLDGISADVVTAASLEAQMISLVLDKLKLDSLYADKSKLDSLYADKAKLDSLYTDKLTLDSLFADKATLDSLYADKITLDSIFADKAILDSLYADKIVIDRVHASIGNVDRVFTSIANIDSVVTDITNIDIVATDITNVNTVSTDITNVNTAAVNIAAINTVANVSNLADIITIADDLNSLDLNGIADVTIVANDLNLGLTGATPDPLKSSVNNVSNSIASVNTVSSVSSQVATLASLSVEIATLGDAQTSAALDRLNTLGTANSIDRLNTGATATNIDRLNTGTTATSIDRLNTGATASNIDRLNTGTTATNIDRLNTGVTAGSIDRLNTLGTADSLDILGTLDTVSDLNILGTLDAVSDMNTLAAISTDITTVSSISTKVSSLYADKITLDSLYADKVTLDSLFADKATLDSLKFDKATLDSLYLDKAKLDSIFADKSKLDSLFADKATLDSLYTDKITLDGLYASKTGIDAVYSNLAEVLLADDNAAIATTKAGEASASASSASTSASTATAQAGIATTKASEAATSESNAATSETNASTSETNAASSASSASSSATTATTKASEALTSANNAATSETNASTSASNAVNSEANASISEGHASTSATNSETSAQNALTSETNASNSASSASTSASNAATSETNASTSETNAATSASSAATSATEAESAKDAAEAARDEAVNFTAGALVSINNLSDLDNLSTALTNLGLDNVDNTSDLDKPISNATALALDDKVDISVLSANVVLFPTTTASDISGYSLMVGSASDPSYNTTAVDIPTGSITTEDQLLASLASDVGIIEGAIEGINVTVIGNIVKTAGNSNAGCSFYFKFFRRDSSGVEHLIGTSNETPVVYDAPQYQQFSESALIYDSGALFAITDRMVIKYYASNINGSPEYNFQFGGVSPVKTLVPVPVTVVVHDNNAEDIVVDALGFNGILSSLDVDVQTALETLDTGIGTAIDTAINAAVSNLVDNSPAALDTLNELAAALGDDPNFATTVSIQIGTKLDSAANAVSASKLNTARTIALSGDVTGSITFDGSADKTMTTVVANNSHTHTISNVTGLQTVLDGKVDDSQVLTNVPAGAVFTDTIYSHPSTHPATMITTTDEFAYSNSTNVQDVLDDLDQAIANVNAKDPVVTLTGAVTGSGTMTNLGNVSIATTATSDPTLTLTGDVTGSATFTNLGNATLTATVANDSHTHSNYLLNNSNDEFVGQLTVDNTGKLASTYTWTGSAIQTTSIEIIDANSNDETVCPTLFMHNYGDGGVKFRMGNTGDKTLYLSSGQGSDAGSPTDNNAGTYFNAIKLNGNIMWHAGNDGSGSGLDADLLDGVQASQFLRSDVSDEISTAGGPVLIVRKSGSAIGNDVTFKAVNTYGDHSWGIVGEMRVDSVAGADRPSMLFSSGNNTNTWSVGYGSSDDNFRINQDHGYHNGGWGTTRFSADRSGNLFAGAINSNKIWHSGNDGSGSGLDADTVDGLHASSFLRADVNSNRELATNVNSSAYSESAIELREYNMAGAQTGAWSEAPRLSFHWGGRVASSIAMDTDGDICIMNNPGSGYEDLRMQDCKVYGTVIESSDARLKENVRPITGALSKVTSLQGVHYNKIETPELEEIGFIAQEVEKVVPEIVTTDDTDEGMKAVSYARTVALLVEAMKEQQAQIEELKLRLKEGGL